MKQIAMTAKRENTMTLGRRKYSATHNAVMRPEKPARAPMANTPGAYVQLTSPRTM